MNVALRGGEGFPVEDVWGDYVGGEEVDLGGGVGDAVVVEVALVGVAAMEDGAFDPFVAVAPQGRLWTRRKWPLRSLFALSGQALWSVIALSGQATMKS